MENKNPEYMIGTGRLFFFFMWRYVVDRVGILINEKRNSAISNN